MAPRHSSTLMTLFSGVLGFILLYIFYASPLRARIENKLFDIRTRLAPTLADASHVAVVEIDERTIATLAPATASGESSKAPRDLDYGGLRAVTEAALAADARVVTVLLPPQVFPYGDPGLAELVALAARDRRLLLGTFDLTLTRRDPEGLPPALRPALTQLAKADVPREFRREIVRDLRVDETGEMPYVARAMAERLDPEAVRLLDERRQDGSVTLKLNYMPPSSLTRINAVDLVKGDGAEALRGRGVLIGYTTYRPWNLHSHEATFVNSPWQADGADLEEGIPVVMLHAIAVENIVQNMSLRALPVLANVLHTTVLTIATLGIWRLGVGFASFVFIGGWSLLLLAHAAFFTFVHRYLPLADTALITSLAMMSGALWRLRLEGRLRVVQEAKASSEAELARMQERFLDRFALELSEINRKIKAALEPHRHLKDAGGTVATAYVRALGSSEELEDYLQGIQQFAALPGPHARKPRLTAVDLAEVTDKVLRQFESRRREQRIEIDVQADGPCLALADGMLVGQILYNLVSNAIKYSPADARVIIKLESDGDTARVVVKDQGPGIPKELKERIFEKFYRIKDDYVYKLKGHGLGLYLSRYFAAEIGASIDVVSEPGDGAEFILTLRTPKVAG